MLFTEKHSFLCKADSCIDVSVNAEIKDDCYIFCPVTVRYMLERWHDHVKMDVERADRMILLWIFWVN